MEIKDVICDAARLGGGPIGISQFQVAQEAPEVLAKMRAEREEADRLYKRQAKIEAILDVATVLVKTGTEPTVALETADTFYRRSKEFAEKFSE